MSAATITRSLSSSVLAVLLTACDATVPCADVSLVGPMRALADVTDSVPAQVAFHVDLQWQIRKLAGKDVDTYSAVRRAAMQFARDIPPHGLLRRRGPITNRYIEGRFSRALEEQGVPGNVAAAIWAEDRYHIGALMLADCKVLCPEAERQLLAATVDASNQCNKPSPNGACASAIDVTAETARRGERLARLRERRDRLPGVDEKSLRIAIDGNLEEIGQLEGHPGFCGLER